LQKVHPALQQELAPQQPIAPLRQTLFGGFNLSSRFLGVAASLLIVCYFGALASLVMWDPNGKSARHMPFEYFATLTWGNDCEWERPSENTPDVEQTGRVLQVRSGMAELLFTDGSRVLLEGPARFEVRSASGGYLHSGKLVASVGPQGMGFKVETKTATIVDLGTEFGVAVSKVGETALNVFVGKVAVRPDAKTETEHPELTIVQSGEAKRITTDGNVEVADSSSSEDWDLLRRNLTIQVAYWSFDDSAEPLADARKASPGQLKNGRLVSGLVGSGALQSDGRSGGLAHIVSDSDIWAFREALTIEAVLISSWSGKPGDSDFIVRRFDDDALAFSLAFKNENGNGPMLALQVDTDRGRQSLKMLLDGQQGRPKLSDLADGRMHHIAATFDGASGRMIIYVDGALRASDSIGSSVLLSDGEAAALEGQIDPLVEDPFSGTLDEVAIYRVAISADEIARHWSNIRHGGNYLLRNP
jgi:hypothetical protein